MSANFVGASSQILRNSAPPVTTYPFTKAFWFRPTAVAANQVIWGLFASASGANYFDLFMSGTSVLTLEAGDGTDRDVTSVTLSANVWYYIVMRYISATNRRMAVLSPDGSTNHVQNTVSCNPTGINRETFGAYDGSGGPAVYCSMQIAESFLTATDIQHDGAQLQDAILRQLAYLGPFSVPNIANEIIEYRSYRKDELMGAAQDIYAGAGKGLQAWTNTNGVTVGQHPPLAANYRRPTDCYLQLMI